MMLPVALLPGNPAATVKEFWGMVECLGSGEGGGVGGVWLHGMGPSGDSHNIVGKLWFVWLIRLFFTFAEQCLLSILCLVKAY